jgi:hypothetical protein
LKPRLSSVGLSRLAEVKTLVRMRPFRPWFAPSLVSRPACGDCAGFIKPATHTDWETARCPESLCPQPVLPPAGRRVPPPKRTLLLPHRSYGLMRRTPIYGSPLLQLLASCEESWQVATSPCCQWVLPDVILKIFPEMLDPVPRRSHRLRLPVSSSVSAAFPTKRLGRLPALFREYDFSRGDFRGCRYSFMFRPPSLLALQIVPTAAHTATGQPELLRPGISCFVTSARTGYANCLNTGN